MKTVFIAISLLAPCAALAQTPTLTVINHFDEPLLFTVGTNPQVLPDFPTEFSLSPGHQQSSKVIDIGKQSYVRASATLNHHAFWGVSLEHEQVKVHGYISKGVAYSWNTQAITFCLPEEYKKNKRC